MKLVENITTEFKREYVEDIKKAVLLLQTPMGEPIYIGIDNEGNIILKMIKDSDGEKFEDIHSINQELTFIEAEKEFTARKIPFGANQQKLLKLMNAEGIYTNLGLLLSD
jgi:hypothetical protein